jgi:hypothetical protein
LGKQPYNGPCYRKEKSPVNTRFFGLNWWCKLHYNVI